MKRKRDPFMIRRCRRVWRQDKRQIVADTGNLGGAFASQIAGDTLRDACKPEAGCNQDQRNETQAHVGGSIPQAITCCATLPDLSARHPAIATRPPTCRFGNQNDTRTYYTQPQLTEAQEPIEQPRRAIRFNADAKTKAKRLKAAVGVGIRGRSGARKNPV